MARKVIRTKVPQGRQVPALSILFTILMICSSLPVLCFVPALSSQAKTTDGRQDSGTWTATKLWADNKLLYCARVGDVWPGHRGNEIVVGGESNWTTMIYGHEDSWTAVRLFQEAWYVTNIAIGDADNNGRNEIVNVGWHGNVSMVYWDNATNKWVHQELVNGLKAHLAWGFGIAIGDFDPRYPGNEVATTDDNGQLTIVRKNATGTGWTYEKVWKDGGNDTFYPYLDTIVFGEVDPGHPGNEMLVTGGSRYVTEIYYNTTASNWTVKRIWRDRSTPIQLAIGNIDPRYPGNEISVAGLDKNMTVLHWNGTGWVPERIWKDFDVLYDTSIGEIVPGKGLEAIVGGWSGNVSAHRRLPGSTSWDSRVLWKAPNQVFGTTIGDFDDLHPGNETVVVDRAGVVTKVQYETPDFVLYSPGPENSAVPGASATFDIMVYSRAGFHDGVSLTLLGLDEEGNATFAPTQVTPTGRSLLTVSLDVGVPLQKITLTIKGVSGGKVHTLEVVIDVLPPDEKDFGMMALPSTQSVVADYSVKYTLALYPVNDFADPVSLSVTGLPDGASAVFKPTVLSPPGSSILEVFTVSSSPLGIHYLTIQGLGGGKVHTATVTLIIKDASSPDFSLGIAPSTITMVGSHSANISVNLISYFGYSDNLLLYVVDLEKGMSAKFSPEFIRPSGTSYLNLTIDASVPADTYYLEIRGETGLLSHSAILRVDLNLAGKPDFTITASQAQVNVTASFVTFCNITVKAISGFGAKVDLTVQGLPSGTNATFTPKAPGPGQTSVLEIKTVITAPASIYHLIIVGQGSGLTRNAYLDLKITPAKAVLNIVRVDGVPSSAQVGQTLKARVWVQNTGLIGASDCVLTMFIDGVVTKTKTFSLNVGGTGSFNLTWTATQGTHNLTITMAPKGPVDILNGRYTKIVKVSGTIVTSPVGLALIAVIVVIIVLAVVLGYVYGRKGSKKVPPKTARKQTKRTRPKTKT
jgi:hypothetical protein